MIDHDSFQPICTQHTEMIIPNVLDYILDHVEAVPRQFDDIRIGVMYSHVRGEPAKAELVGVDVVVGDTDESLPVKLLRIVLSKHQARAIASNLFDAAERLDRK